MCPPPCGPRRAWRSPREKRPTIKTRISKSEVREIVSSGNYECLYRDDLTKVNATYDGCTDNLLMILHDGATKVKVAGYRSGDYKENYRTVILDAPCLHAVILLRTKL